MLRLLRLPEVEDVTGLSATTIWRREKEGKFPRRRRVAGNLVAWRSDEIERWVESRPPADVTSDPARSG